MPEHPFAPFIRILARGPSFIRDLHQDEARQAFGMILRDEAQPIQAGAFLMLMRYKGEKAPELAGFVRAVRDLMARPEPLPRVDVDWPSYAAGRTRGVPWFVLSALLLARSGIRVFLHGSNEYQSQGQPTGRALQSLGIAPSASLAEAAERLGRDGIAFAPLENFAPKLHEILGLRPILGLRSPANTVARSLNPFEADCTVAGVFHPPFRDLHQQAALLLGHGRMATIKGGGGEFERNPAKACQVCFVRGDQSGEENWPPLPGAAPMAAEDDQDLERLGALWRGEWTDPNAVALVTGTAAVVLWTLGRAADRAAAERLAVEMWEAH